MFLACPGRHLVGPRLELFRRGHVRGADQLERGKRVLQQGTRFRGRAHPAQVCLQGLSELGGARRRFLQHRRPASTTPGLQLRMLLPQDGGLVKISDASAISRQRWPCRRCRIARFTAKPLISHVRCLSTGENLYFGAYTATDTNRPLYFRVTRNLKLASCERPLPNTAHPQRRIFDGFINCPFMLGRRGPRWLVSSCAARR